MVLNIDKDNERFSLGIKQLATDPWDEVPEKYRPGTRITGRVTNITDFGVFVELEEGIEGLIHVSELAKEKGREPAEPVQGGRHHPGQGDQRQPGGQKDRPSPCASSRRATRRSSTTAM